MSLRLLAIASLLSATACASNAASTRPNDPAAAPNLEPKQAAAQAELSAAETLALSAQLARWGRQQQNPAALALAAQMLDTTSSQPLAVSDQKTKGGAGEAAPAGTAQLPAAAALRDEAKQLAGDDEKALAVVESIGAAPRARGRFEGVKSHCAVAQAGAADSFVVNFNGKEPAELVLMGDGQSDLDLAIYDVGGNEIDADARTGDIGFVQWTPSWTAPFLVEVKNLGDKPNSYCVSTN